MWNQSRFDQTERAQGGIGIVDRARKGNRVVLFTFHVHVEIAFRVMPCILNMTVIPLENPRRLLFWIAIKLSGRELDVSDN